MAKPGKAKAKKASHKSVGGKAVKTSHLKKKMC